MLVIEQRCPRQVEVDGIIELPFDLRCRSRLRTRLTSGEEVGLFLDRGSILRGGDCLRAGDGRVIRVEPAREALMRVEGDSPLTLTRAAYHLGNRHVPLQVEADCLRCARDDVLREMLLGLGVRVIDEDSPFEPEAGAYGGGHRHDQDGHDPVIHSAIAG